jgi:uncharacterized protein (TIGR02453 family)
MIDKSTLEFLKNLSKNNNREWFNANKPLYEKGKKNILDVTLYLISEIGKSDKSVQYVNPEECLFRIYKDVRFSKDKNPYKTNFGSFIIKGGRKTPGAGYYLHIEPGKSFLVGGIYMPSAPHLLAIRSAIAKKPETFIKIINNYELKKLFGELCDETLKTAPKGFPKDHPAIQLLRYKHYYFMRNVSDKEILSDDFLKQAVKDYKVVSPFVKYINAVLY